MLLLCLIAGIHYKSNKKSAANYSILSYNHITFKSPDLVLLCFLSYNTVQMNEAVRLTIQVIISLAIIYAGIWGMFRIPGKPVLDSAAAPILAFSSVWVGMVSIITAIYLWITAIPDIWVVVVVIAYSAAISIAGFCMWIYRHTPPSQFTEPIHLQRLQARVGIMLGMISVVLWYIFILTHKQILTPTGP